MDGKTYLPGLSLEQKSLDPLEPDRDAVGRRRDALVFEYQYPDEPQANSKRTVTVSKDGTVFDGETVIERNQYIWKK